MLQQHRRNEPRADREHVPICVAGLAMHIEARCGTTSVSSSRAHHRDIEQAALLLDLLVRSLVAALAEAAVVERLVFPVSTAIFT